MCHLRVVKWFALSARDNCSTIASASLTTQDFSVSEIFACSGPRNGKHGQGCQNSRFPPHKTRTLPLEILVNATITADRRTPGSGKMGASGG